jgi:hypothetical protein
VASPEAASELVPELSKRSGLAVKLYVAGLSDLLRTIGPAYEAAQRGQRAWQGPELPKNASRTSLRGCAITPYGGSPAVAPAPQQRPASRRTWNQSGPFAGLPTPAEGIQRTPPSMAAVRRPPPDDLRVVKAPAPSHSTLANDIAATLAELAPDAPAPLITPPPPPAPPEPAAAAAPEEEVRTGLRALAHKIKEVANTDLSVAFKRPSSGQHKPVAKPVPASVRSTSAGEKSAPDAKKTVPSSRKLSP